MARAFRLRFKGREKEVVEQIKFLGHDEFCRQEGISGFALQKWFQKQPGCENDSIYHYFHRSPSMQDLPILQQCALAIIKEREQNRKLFAEKDAELDEVKGERDEYREKLRVALFEQWKQLKALHRLCTENVTEEVEL